MFLPFNSVSVLLNVAFPFLMTWIELAFRALARPAPESALQSAAWGRFETDGKQEKPNRTLGRRYLGISHFKPQPLLGVGQSLKWMIHLTVGTHFGHKEYSHT